MGDLIDLAKRRRATCYWGGMVVLRPGDGTDVTAEMVDFWGDDLCATDITEGTCHAACLEGSPVVDLGTGDPVEGKADTYRFDSLAGSARNAR